MKGVTIDRVVGFAGIYPDNTVPLGPVVQVRRDDSYRWMGGNLNGPGPKVGWYCAYYITKDTPKQVTTPATNSAGVFTLVPEGSPDEGYSYDQMLDDNLGDEISVTKDGESWGGNLFGFDLQLDETQPEDDTPLEAYNDSALDDLKGGAPDH